MDDIFNLKMEDILEPPEMYVNVKEFKREILSAFDAQDTMDILPCHLFDIMDSIAKPEARLIRTVPPACGQWIGIQYDGYADGNPVFDVYECSECGHEENTEDPPPYCSCCGAKMDLQTSEDDEPCD